MFRYLFFDRVSSTNDCAKELGLQGHNNIAVIAKEQTKGKGRLGRSFSSCRNNGLYLSLLFQPEDPLLVPIIAALSVYQVVAKYSRDPVSIKWPNDILVQAGSADKYKKICGILCESFLKDGRLHVICGIGINIADDFDEELKDIATCLQEHSDFHWEIDELAREVCLAFASLMQKEKSVLIIQYKSHLRNLNRKVRVLKGQDEIVGTCVDLNEKGELLIQTEKGDLVTVHSGEVSIRDCHEESSCG